MDSDEVIIKQASYTFSRATGKRLLPDPGTEWVFQPTSDPSSAVQVAVEQLFRHVNVEISPSSARETAERFSVYTPTEPDQCEARSDAIASVASSITRKLVDQSMSAPYVTWTLASFGGGSGIFLQRVFKHDGLLRSQLCCLIDSTNAVHTFFFHDV